LFDLEIGDNLCFPHLVPIPRPLFAYYFPHTLHFEAYMAIIIHTAADLPELVKRTLSFDDAPENGCGCASIHIGR
jgi:hypothetical protein